MRSRNYPELDHEIEVSIEDSMVVITTPTGKEIARVYVETMEGGGDDGSKPTQNYWVRFVPTMKCNLEDSAEVTVE